MVLYRVFTRFPINIRNISPNLPFLPVLPYHKDIDKDIVKTKVDSVSLVTNQSVGCYRVFLFHFQCDQFVGERHRLPFGSVRRGHDVADVADAVAVVVLARHVVHVEPGRVHGPGALSTPLGRRRGAGRVAVGVAGVAGRSRRRLRRVAAATPDAGGHGHAHSFVASR